MSQELNALQQAMKAKANKEIVVKAEDLQEDGRDWSEIFLEPQPGETYVVKFLMNLSPNIDNFEHRSVYKDLPDPKRKGKSFHYISSGKSDTCQALELFFELNELKKAGDIVAEQKIEKYMGRSQQGATLVQIQSAPKTADVGKIRILSVPTWGANATITNLLNKKLNPTESQIKAGIEKEDVFALTPTSIMVIECVEATFDGVKGRDFTNSTWGAKKAGMKLYSGVEGDDNRTVEYEFQEGDIDPETFEVKAGTEAHFAKAIELLQAENIDILNQFSYKTRDTAGMTDATKKYINDIYDKVEAVIPIIRDSKTIGEIEAKLGSSAKENGGDDAETIGGAKKEDILKESIPELDGTKQAESASTEQAAPTNTVDDILKNASQE